MKCLHHRDALGACGIVAGRGYQREGIVNVHDVDVPFPNQRLQLLLDPAVPDGIAQQFQMASFLDAIVVFLKPDHSMAMSLKKTRFQREDLILAPWLLVGIVDEQDVHELKG